SSWRSSSYSPARRSSSRLSGSMWRRSIRSWSSPLAPQSIAQLDLVDQPELAGLDVAGVVGERQIVEPVAAAMCRRHQVLAALVVAEPAAAVEAAVAVARDQRLVHGRAAQLGAARLDCRWDRHRDLDAAAPAPLGRGEGRHRQLDVVADDGVAAVGLAIDDVGAARALEAKGLVLVGRRQHVAAALGEEGPGGLA